MVTNSTGREQSFVLNQLLVLADACYPLSVIGIIPYGCITIHKLWQPPGDKPLLCTHGSPSCWQLYHIWSAYITLGRASPICMSLQVHLRSLQVRWSLQLVTGSGLSWTLTCGRWCRTVMEGGMTLWVWWAYQEVRNLSPMWWCCMIEWYA